MLKISCTYESSAWFYIIWSLKLFINSEFINKLLENEGFSKAADGGAGAAPWLNQRNSEAPQGAGQIN